MSASEFALNTHCVITRQNYDVINLRTLSRTFQYPRQPPPHPEAHCIERLLDAATIITPRMVQSTKGFHSKSCTRTEMECHVEILEETGVLSVDSASQRNERNGGLHFGGLTYYNCL